MARSELGDYLVARRARVSPLSAGLPSLGPRRVAGLRREEVAALAGMSVDYYTRLEQGRERRPSPAVLDALARTLELGGDARAHLFRLGGAAPPASPASTPDANPLLRRLLDAWPVTPALVLDRRLAVLASNELADALFSAFSGTDSLARMVFDHPAAAGFFVDWPQAADDCVAHLRLAHGHDPSDRVLRGLVADLAARSVAFADRWHRHEVRGKTVRAKAFRHPEVGDLTLTSHALDVRDAPGQQVVVYQAEPGSPSEQALQLLGSLAASRR